MKRAAALILAVLTVCLYAVADSGPTTDTSTQVQDLVRFGSQDMAHGLAATALFYFNEALELQPNCADAWAGKARALEKLNRLDEAYTASQKALQLAPDNQYAWAMEGKILLDQTQFSDALSALNKSISLGNNDTAVWRWQGQTLDSLNRHDEALKAYSKATPPVEPYHGGITRVTSGGPSAKQLQQEETDSTPGKPQSAVGGEYLPDDYRYDEAQNAPPVANYDNSVPGNYSDWSYGLGGYDGSLLSESKHRRHRAYSNYYYGYGSGPAPVAPRTVAPYRGVVPLYQQGVVPQYWQGVVPPYQQQVEPDYRSAAGDPIISDRYSDQNNGYNSGYAGQNYHRRHSRVPHRGH